MDFWGWWTRWWSGDEDAREKIFELKDKLEKAFEPVVCDLVEQTKKILIQASERFARSGTLAVKGALSRLEEAKTERQRPSRNSPRPTFPGGRVESTSCPSRQGRTRASSAISCARGSFAFVMGTCSPRWMCFSAGITLTGLCLAYGR